VALFESLSSSKRVMEMLLTGEDLSASTAFHYGMINKVCDHD
jgi:enoyl-CoA hydratase/carnithine racemase